MILSSRAFARVEEHNFKQEKDCYSRVSSNPFFPLIPHTQSPKTKKSPEAQKASGGWLTCTKLGRNMSSVWPGKKEKRGFGIGDLDLGGGRSDLAAA